MTKLEINQLFSTGKKIYTPLVKAVYLPSETTSVIISAPIKVWKRAVDRNRIKRLIREALMKKEIGKFNIAFIYSGTTIKSLSEIKEDIDKILFRLKS